MPSQEGDDQTQSGLSPAPPGTPPDAAPPAADQTRWRERALELEAQLQDAQTKLAAAESALQAAQQAVQTSQRSRQIERQLTDAGAIDMETALLLTETAVAQNKSQDVPGAVADLRRRKPWLFRPVASSAASSAMGAPSSVDHAGAAAREAAATGDRRALLRYLRARRSN